MMKVAIVLSLAGAAAWANDDGESRRTGVVLEAGRIDSSTVEVGALAVVVYGQGERHPTSGAWAKLDTVRGYIKAVRRRSLTLSLERYGWPESIALERIQSLVLVGSSSLGEADRDSTQIDYGHPANRFQAVSNSTLVKMVRGGDRGTGM